MARSETTSRRQLLANSAAAVALAVGLGAMTGCANGVSPSDLGETSRPLGSPAGDQLEDLNVWLSNIATIDGDVSFDPDSPDLTDEGKRILEKLLPHLQNTDGSILIEGFADGVGGDSEHNQWLSDARALSVKDWLVSEGKVDETRFLKTIGHGARDTVNGRAAIDGVPDPNRRVVQITVNQQTES